MSILDQTILERHSIRKLLLLPVPREVVDEAQAQIRCPESHCLGSILTSMRTDTTW
jgi:hypothetical protein